VCLFGRCWWPRGLRRRSWSLFAGIAGSNPARGVDIRLCVYVYAVLSSVSRGLCDDLITRIKESYLVSN
jgi:hypothetical protein